jgi:hypothetical protein
MPNTSPDRARSVSRLEWKWLLAMLPAFLLGAAVSFALILGFAQAATLPASGDAPPVADRRLAT